MLRVSSCFDFTWSSSAIGSDSAGQEILPASIGPPCGRSVGQGEFFHVVTRSPRAARTDWPPQSISQLLPLARRDGGPTHAQVEQLARIGDLKGVALQPVQVAALGLTQAEHDLTPLTRPSARNGNGAIFLPIMTRPLHCTV